jgi:hypothetical protein
MQRPKKHNPVKPGIQLVQRDPTKLRLHEFRGDDRLVSEAGKIASIPFFQTMLDVLRNEHPCRNVAPPTMTMEARAAMQCQAEGYSMCLANLEAMAIAQQVSIDTESEFQQEDFNEPKKGK